MVRIQTPFIALVGLCLAGSPMAAEPGNARPWEARLQKYFVTKEREARSLAKQLNLQIPPEISDYFDAGTRSDWPRANKIFDAMSRTWRQQHNATAIAPPVMEVVLAYEGYTGMEMKFVESFARDI